MHKGHRSSLTSFTFRASHHNDEIQEQNKASKQVFTVTMQSINSEMLNDDDLISDRSVSTNGASSTNNGEVTESASSNPKRTIDQTSDAKTLIDRRAYNRECAARARKRAKQNVSELENHIKGLQEDKAELRRSLATMERRIDALTRENTNLLAEAKHMSTDAGSGFPSSYSNGIGELMNPSLPSVQYLQMLQLQERQRLLQLNKLRVRGYI